MEKIIIIGPIGSGKTTLAEAIITLGSRIIITPNKKTSYIKMAVESFERVAFEDFSGRDCRYLKTLLVKDKPFNLTHIVCTFQERPKWLTAKFAKVNRIKVFHLNPLRG